MTLILDPVPPPKKANEKTYVVGRDDVSELGLSFEEIDRILMAAEWGDDENSPLSLDYRVLDDLSVLHLGRGRAGYRTLSIVLKCYQSARHLGVNYRNDASSYEYGPILWKISATYTQKDGYDKVDYAHVFDYLYLGQPEHHVFAMTEVLVTGPIDAIASFGAFYRQLQDKLTGTKAWMDLELDAVAECSCDHVGVIRSTTLRRLFRNGLSLDDLRSRLKCDQCGKKTSITMTPAYSERTPRNFRHRTMWVPPREKPVPRRDTTGNTGLRDIYDALGGDGSGSVYLGDGASISPGGRVFDD